MRRCTWFYLFLINRSCTPFKMSPSNAVSGLEHFKRLNGSISIHEPTTTSSSSNGPDLILICGWMDAQPRHIAKYTAAYEKLYPSARILVVTTTAIDAAFVTWAANYKRVDLVLEILYTLPPDAKFLLHLFSNGGAFTNNLIANRYRERTGKTLPTTAIILDSTPGRATYEATVRAFAVALPKNLVFKVLGILALRLVFGLYRLAYHLKGLLVQEGHMDLVERVRVDLNTKSLIDVGSPRLYIYSEADDMVHWQFVEEHIEEAEKLGCVVHKEKFLESGHCGHLTIDSKRYWAAVQRLWSLINRGSSIPR
jgi:hypothetical protein